MKFKELLAKVLKNKVGRIVSIIVFATIVLVVTLLLTYDKEPEVDTTYLIAKIQESSELTTAKLEYTGFSKFKDDGIPIINRSDFLMVYTATARAGIDVKNVKVDADKLTKTIWITIPKAEILEVHVEADKITYYDEKFALFNVDKKEDSDRAQVSAEEKAKKELEKMGILKMADDQAETLLKGLLQGAIPEGYTMKVKK